MEENHVLSRLAKTLRRSHHQVPPRHGRRKQLQLVYPLLKQASLHHICKQLSMLPEILQHEMTEEIPEYSAAINQLGVLRLESFSLNTQREASAIIAESLGLYDAAETLRHID